MIEYIIGNPEDEDIGENEKVVRTLVKLMEFDREIAIELLVYWSDRAKYTRDRVDTPEVQRIIKRLTFLKGA